MDERKIIDRTLLADLAKEVGLNASHLEALGESRQLEIVVDGDMLERLVEIQYRCLPITMGQAQKRVMK